MSIQVHEGVAIDPTTKAGFIEIASAYGRDAAHTARIAILRQRAQVASMILWHDRMANARLGAALFEQAWEQRNPLIAQLRHERGEDPLEPTSDAVWIEAAAARATVC